MTIDNHRDRDDQDCSFPASQAEAHALIALEQSALYAARLAIARWINSSSETAFISDSPAARTIWYSQAQQNFQEWLGRGGFAQYDCDISCNEEFAPVMADFSQLRANPMTDSGTSPANSCVD